MNNIHPSRTAFIVPSGTKLKRNKDADSLKIQRESLKSCLNKEKSDSSKRVYEVEADE